MKRTSRVAFAGAVIACAGSVACATDFHIPLNWNWNGLVHPTEFSIPDDLNGFRSISDRSLSIDGGSNSLGSTPIVGVTGITYEVVTTDFALDIVHLGNTGAGTARPWDTVVDGDNLGVIPSWLPANNAHLTPQVTDVSGQNLTLDASSAIGFLYFVSNGGGNFNVVLTFTDNSTVTVTLRANDWFGPTNPPAANPGVASQTRLGGTTYTGTSNNDLPIIQSWPTQSLAVTEAVITVQSIAQAGLGNVVGKQLASISLGSPSQPNRGYAIMAATVVTGLGPPANDNCANAATVVDGANAGENLRATGATTSPCGSQDTTDVWYRYTATSTGTVEARTCGAAFDTTLAIYGSCGGAAVACNDDGCGFASRVQWAATQGQTYLIRVAGNNATDGTFTLNIEPNAPTHTDVPLALAYNWNGLVHDGEDGLPDAPSGYRSISDRGLVAFGAPGDFNGGLVTGTDYIPYAVATQANQVDLVNLGTRVWDGAPDGDNQGVQPTWFLPPGPQRTNLASMYAFMGANTRIGVVYQISNGGGFFDVVLDFSDGSTVAVTLSGPDWYLDQHPVPPLVGVEVQRQLGVYNASQNADLAALGAPALNVAEAVFSTSSILASGQGDVTGRWLTGITFQNPDNVNRGTAILAATLRDAAPPSGPVPPVASGLATPSTVAASQSTLFTVAVTPGLNPPSTGITVAGDLSTLGGSAAQTFYDNGTNGDAVAGDNTFSYQMTVSAAQAPGSYTIPFTAQDAQARSASGNIALTVNPPPPANDSCSEPQAINGYGEFTFDTTWATTDGPGACVAGANDVWFCWTAGETGLAVVETCGLASFDSVLVAYDGCACPAGAPLSCNDDSCGVQSKISFNATAGSSYLIRVAGWSATDRGLGSINVRSGVFGPFVNATNGSTYYLFESTNGWNAAQALSVALGGNLATINDADENEYVRASVLGHDGADRRAWIGFNDVANPGEYVWVSGEPVTFTNWAAGEPNNPTTEHWTEMLGSSGLWNNQTEPSGVVAWGVAEINPGAGCDPDVNCDGVPDQGDVACIILAVAGDMSCFCQADPDFNHDGVPDQGDVGDLILTVAGAPCP